MQTKSIIIMDNIIKIDTVDQYNRLYGLCTDHPLVAVVDLSKAEKDLPSDCTINYGVYALFLKNVKCGDIRYGRQPYDYQEGTVTSFAPGQVVTFHKDPNVTSLDVHGLIFHPDIIHGTSLGKDIRRYSFFSYNSTEALHLSDDEKALFKDCLEKIRMEITRPVDKHSKRLIAMNIELLLDYCMRFYDRQFITRSQANQGILVRFSDLLDEYFQSGQAEAEGLPTVKYFADKVCLSPNYFGDLIKKESGKTAQEHIQNKIIDIAKDRMLGSDKTVSQIAYELGFQYSQHFSRLFKKITGSTPMEYRRPD